MSKQRWISGIGLAGLALGLAACVATGSLQLPGGRRIQQQPGTALLERKSGRIVYVGSDGNIYVTDQGGVSRTALTTDASQTETFYHSYRWPAWSPDSSQLAFVGESGTPGGAADDSVLYTVPREGGVLTEAHITEESQLFYLYWSPDGQYLGFLAANQTERIIELEAVNADGSSARPLQLGTGAPLWLTWAPDGETVLMHVNGERSDSVLGAVNLSEATTDDLHLEEFPYSPAAFQAPAWSPDGKMILFATRGDGEQDHLVVADAQGGEPRTVTEYLGKIGFAWSPNSRYVAYIESEETPPFTPIPSLGVAGSLHIYDLRRNQTIDVSEEDDVLAFFWSPNSQKLAYFTPRLVSDPDSTEQALVLTLKIATAQNGAAHQLFRFVPPEEFLQMLLFFDQFQRSATIWSPDSQNVVFAVQEDTPIIAVMHVSGNLDPRPVAEGTLAFWSWK